MRPADSLLCATWNLHRGRGADGRIDPARTLRALVEEVCQPCPDVLALQEADAERPPYPGFLDLSALEGATGLIHAQRATCLRWGAQSHGFHGNILLLGPDITVVQAQVLDLPGVYPRGAVVIEALRAGTALRLITLHLSLTQILRAVQMRTLAQYLARRPGMPTILLGDLNEWRPWGGLALSPRVTGLRLNGPARATFPAARPILPLDRILSDGEVRDTEVLCGPHVRAASDHAALRATVHLAAPRR